MLPVLLARSHGSRIILAFFAVVAIFLLIPVAIRTVVAPHLYSDIADVPSAQVAVVPGASVVRGEPSNVLAERIDMAAALYKEGRVQKILITGDNGERSYDEVTAALNYLLSRDVPARDVFLDRAGFDTYSSMYRARRIFKARSVIVVTQDFHIPRSVFLARALGMEAEGLVAGGGGTARDYAREIPASLKAMYDLAVRRKPDHAGAPIPLSGPGNAGR